jgi:hypothetical protein
MTSAPGREHGWDRNDWVNKLEEALVRAGLPFYIARLRERHGQPSSSLYWMMEAREILKFASTYLSILPVKRKFSLKETYREAVRALTKEDRSRRQHAQSLYYRAYGELKHLLTPDDTRAFYALAHRDFEFMLWDGKPVRRRTTERKKSARTRKTRVVA